MVCRKEIALVVLMAAGMAENAWGQWFTPLADSRPIGVANDAAELNGPWHLPAGFTLEKLTSVYEAETSPGQSTVRVPGLGSNASMFDMVALSADSRYVFVPHETQYGAGVSRYDRQTDTMQVMFQGDRGGATGNWSQDYGAFDPATWSPWNTLLVAEEWSGLGRLIEVTNPLDPIGTFQVVDRVGIPSVAHEGLQFDAAGNMYFVDEWNSGSIYRFTPKQIGDLSVGQTSVLKIDAYAGDPTKNYNDPSNANNRTGLATWVPITDAEGLALPGITNPYLRGDNSTETSRGGRIAANEVLGTPYGRPEDLDFSKLANGNDAIYFAATSEQSIYSIELLGGNTAHVRLAASQAVTPKNLGYGPTSATLASPDNIAVDPMGNVYVIEDQPNTTTVGNPGGDVWMLRDVDRDGVAESLDLFATMGVAGAEGTGMIWDKNNPQQFLIAVQHPASLDMVGGQGDSLWQVTVPEPSSGLVIVLSAFSFGLLRRR